ncbi:hypothetical protein SAMN05660657_05066 [Geodermatophilus amargosae]|uniref:Uncharacterized protein n=1 Tax=Geodermatophilus amargosae TaxID=1296565 RepID=A0A1I7CZ37_9ACTN|nr:hypothetical protein SAMN05660657_05066 [Geodermatophilus amargosae]
MTRTPRAARRPADPVALPETAPAPPPDAPTETPTEAPRPRTRYHCPDCHVPVSWRPPRADSRCVSCRGSLGKRRHRPGSEVDVPVWAYT